MEFELGMMDEFTVVIASGESADVTFDGDATVTFDTDPDVTMGTE